MALSRRFLKLKLTLLASVRGLDTFVRRANYRSMKDLQPQFEPVMPSEDQFGPAMRRLTPLQRRFVVGLSVWGGNASEAARWAGYSTESDGALRVTAHRTLNLDYVKEAIKEESWRRLDEASLLAVSTVVRIAMNSTEDKVALKAAELLMDRTGFHAKSEHVVTIEDRRTTNELLDFIRLTAAKHGLDGNKLLGLPAPVDAEFTEVTNGSEGLEDLL